MAVAKVKKQYKEAVIKEYNSEQDEENSSSKESADDKLTDNEAEAAEEGLSDNETDEEAVVEENNTDSEDGNAGWADSIAKVLSSTKPKTKKLVVLSRAKKLQPGKETVKKQKPSYDFEIEGEIKEEKPDNELKPDVKQRKNLQLPLRVRPTWKDIERERTLRKIATKGVVQLFNAVRMQQKDLEQQLEKAGPLDSRKDAVLNNINKKKFLDVLMSGSRAKSEVVDNSVKVENNGESSSNSGESAGEEDERASDSGRKRKSQWSVLRSDFMTNKKIKHWDEEDDDKSDENQNRSNDDSEDDNQ